MSNPNEHATGEYLKELPELFHRLRTGRGQSLDALRRLHRVGVWSNGGIGPRGTLTSPAASRLAEPKSISILLSFLADGDSDEAIRRAAALAIGAWAGEEAVKPLAGIFSDDSHPAVQLSVISALAAIGGLESLEALAHILTLPSSDLQNAALSGILDLASGGSSSDTESPVSLSIRRGAREVLAPDPANRLRSALMALRESATVPIALRLRAGEALQYLSGSGMFSQTGESATAAEETASVTLGDHSTAAAETLWLRASGNVAVVAARAASAWEGTTVFLERAGRGMIRAARLDALGRIMFGDLEPGEYRILASSVSGELGFWSLGLAGAGTEASEAEAGVLNQERDLPESGLHASAEVLPGAQVRVAFSTTNRELAGASVRFGFAEPTTGRIQLSGTVELEPHPQQPGKWVGTWQYTLPVTTECELLFAVEKRI